MDDFCVFVGPRVTGSGEGAPWPWWLDCRSRGVGEWCWLTAGSEGAKPEEAGDGVGLTGTGKGEGVIGLLGVRLK